MTDLIENKARQLEHDAKNLEDEDDNLAQPQPKETTTVKTSAKKPANPSEDKYEKGGPGTYVSTICHVLYERQYLNLL